MIEFKQGTFSKEDFQKMLEIEDSLIPRVGRVKFRLLKLMGAKEYKPGYLEKRR